MMNNPQERQLLRRALVRGLEAADGAGMTIPSLRNVAVMAGHDDVEFSAVARELAYLADKGLIAELAQHISPEIKRWRIVAEGRDWLAEA